MTNRFKTVSKFTYIYLYIFKKTNSMEIGSRWTSSVKIGQNSEITEDRRPEVQEKIQKATVAFY